MSRRNNARRRHTYGRRQHELRERRPGETESDRWEADELIRPTEEGRGAFANGPSQTTGGLYSGEEVNR